MLITSLKVPQPGEYSYTYMLVNGNELFSLFVLKVIKTKLFLFQEYLNKGDDNDMLSV